MICDVHPVSGFPDPDSDFFPSRIQGSKKHWIPFSRTLTWVDDIRKTMYFLNTSNSYSLVLFSRIVILWRVFSRQCLHSKKNSSDSSVPEH